MTTSEASRYLKLYAQLERAEDLLESLQNASRVKTQTINPHLKWGSAKSSAVKDHTASLVIEVEELRSRISSLKRRVTREEKKLIDYADTIDNEILRSAFRMKYLRGMTWVEISDIMGYNYSDDCLKKGCIDCLKRIVTGYVKTIRYSNIKAR